MEVKTRHEILHNKLGRLVELHLLHHLLHTMQTRTLGTEHRILTLFRSFPEGSLQFRTLTIGYVKHTLRLPDLSAAHTLHTFREDDLIARLSTKLDNLIHQVVLLPMELRLSHRLVDTAGEINDLQRQVFLFFLGDRFFDDELGEITLLRLAMLFGHSCRPEWQTHFVHTPGNTCHHRWSQRDMSKMCHIEYHT